VKHRTIPFFSHEDLVQEALLAILAAPPATPEANLVQLARTRLRDLRDREVHRRIRPRRRRCRRRPAPCSACTVSVASPYRDHDGLGVPYCPDCWETLLRRQARDFLYCLERLRADVWDPGPESWEELAAREEFDRMLEELTRQQALVFVLRYRQGLSNGEIAATLNVTPGTVSAAHFQAVARLRARLAQGQVGDATPGENLRPAV
jgi:RNA polymerase sigma factor (sigma-70 family)